jgi:hypothetical protein
MQGGSVRQAAHQAQRERKKEFNSFHAVLVAAMLRIFVTYLRGFSQLGSAQTLHLSRAKASCTCKCDHFSSSETFSSHAVKQPLDTTAHWSGQALLAAYQQNRAALPCKIATRHTTSNSRINCNDHLSSAECCVQKLIEGLGRVHHADASTEVH